MLQRVAPLSHPVVSEGELFRRIMGPEWRSLHPDIQKRFEKNPALDKPLHYTGTLSELSCNRAGRILAWLTFPFLKGALIPFSDRGVPVDIVVYSKPDCPSIFKQRTYRLNRRRPIRFTSYMRESRRGEVLEYVGLGLGMKLILHVEDGNLHFTSDGYFWQLFGWRIRLPTLLTPGVTHLRHGNDSPAQFNIRIEIRHRLFGTTFRQVGVFSEIETQSA